MSYCETSNRTTTEVAGAELLRSGEHGAAQDKNIRMSSNIHQAHNNDDSKEQVL